MKRGKFFKKLLSMVLTAGMLFATLAGTAGAAGIPGAAYSLYWEGKRQKDFTTNAQGEIILVRLLPGGSDLYPGIPGQNRAWGMEPDPGRNRRHLLPPPCRGLPRPQAPDEQHHLPGRAPKRLVL